MLGTLDKATTVLMLFSGRPEWGVSEVSRELGAPKSSTHSLLTSLAQAGLLEHTSDNRYRLGWRLLTLSRSLLDGSSLLVAAQPTVRALRRRLDATVHLATLNSGQITYIDKVDGRRSPVLGLSAVGSRAPAHCTALGKVLLAYGPSSAVVEAADASYLRRYTDNTICRLAELQGQLTTIRRVRYACDREEMLEGVCCFAAPITDADGRALAAISVVVHPKTAVADHEHLSRVVVAAGDRIGRSMRATIGNGDAAPAGLTTSRLRRLVPPIPDNGRTSLVPTLS